MGRAAKRGPRPYRRDRYMLDLGLQPSEVGDGRYCPRCGERVYLVQSPDGTQFLITSAGGKVLCYPTPQRTDNA